MKFKKLLLLLFIPFLLFTNTSPAYASVSIIYTSPVYIFNPSTTFSQIVIGVSSPPETVTVSMVDFDNRTTIRNLWKETLNDTSYHYIIWEGKNNSGVLVPNGQYYYKVTSSSGNTVYRPVSVEGQSNGSFLYDPFGRGVRIGVTAYMDRYWSQSGIIQDYRGGSRSYDGHKGTDYAASYRTSLYSAQAGNVTVGTDYLAGYYVAVQSSNGITITYQHMESDGRPSNGTSVSAGQNVGYSGNSGQNTTGPHLHVRKEIGPVWQGTISDVYNTSQSDWIVDPRPDAYPGY